MTPVVAITGATGFVGSHLTHRLTQEGKKVRVLARNPEKAKKILPSSVEIFQGDITSPENVLPFINGATHVYHLASILQEPGTPDDQFWKVHVEGTQNLLNAALEFGVKRFVHFSTIGVLGSPKKLPANETSPYRTKDIYQRTKCEGEKLAIKTFKEKGLSGVVIRPAAVYGPGDMRMLKLFRFISKGKFRMIGKGNIFAHPVYVEDLVSGALLAGERDNHSGEIYILGGEKPVLLKDWVQLIAHTLGTKIKKGSIPFWPVWIAAFLCEGVCKPIGVHPPLFRRRVEFFSKSRAFDISKAKRELGYQPKFSLEEGIKQTGDWYKENGYL